MLHVHAAYLWWISLLHVHAACPYFVSMSPCRMSMVNEDVARTWTWTRKFFFFIQ
jgi:hypothetical protein